MKITIIGAGPGGYETAVEAAGRGIEVTLVSAGPVGGTCLNEGCIPTKALLRSAELCDEVAAASEFGVNAGECNLDFLKAAARKDEVVAQLRAGVEFLLKNKLITLLRGKALLAGGKAVKVVLDEGGEVTVESDYVIIATGSISASLPISGADLPGVITSKEFLSMTELPESVCVIGGGVIGLEFASMLRSFGKEVTVLEYCPDILPRFDTDLAKRLKQSLSKRGIKIETSAQVTSIETSPEGLITKYIRKETECSVTASKVLMAVGRRPNLASLELEAAGIAASPKGVVVDQYMQTSIPGIYAIGDITGGYMLAHVATFQGRRALNHILAGCPAEGPVDNIRLDIVPAAVFTTPEAACVGLTEDECKAGGIPVKVHKSFFRACGKAVAMGETDGFCKIVASEADGRILGCHLFGPHASDIVQEAAALITRDATLSDLRDTIHAHPTLPEVLLSAAGV